MTKSKKFNDWVLLPIIFVNFALLESTVGFAQPLTAPVFNQKSNSTGIASKTETSPTDDAVLIEAPEKLNIKFPDEVRLVKLTLRNEERDWVDINFRYSPLVQDAFSLDLPALVPAVYYTADWAILSENDRLVYGSFSFSFGEEAKRPSLIRAVEEELLLDRYGDPTIRYVPPPRTQIIIDQDPPRYDPPFVIDLEENL